MYKSPLATIMGTVSGSSFVGFDSETEVKLTGGKKNPQLGRVTKVMTGASVVVFQNKVKHGYFEMVQRRLTAEGKTAEFTLGKRIWGERVKNLPIVTHKGKEYMEVIVLKAGDISYLLDGKPIAKADIIGLPKKAVGGEQGGLDNKVIIRTFKVESITALRINKTEYTSKDILES